MKRWFWVDGRLAWPLVFGMAYLAASLVIADYFWRITVMPFESFALYGLAIAGATAILVIAGSAMVCRNIAAKTCRNYQPRATLVQTRLKNGADILIRRGNLRD